VNYNKGSVVGYTAVLRSNLVNNFRWGFTRESVGTIGNSSEQWIFSVASTIILVILAGRAHSSANPKFHRGFVLGEGKTYAAVWCGLAFIRNPRNSQLASFSDGSTNASWLDTAGFVGGGDAHFDPGACPSGGVPTATSPCLPEVAEILPIPMTIR